jgi:hypothetical protein
MIEVETLEIIEKEIKSIDYGKVVLIITDGKIIRLSIERSIKLSSTVSIKLE